MEDKFRTLNNIEFIRLDDLDLRNVISILQEKKKYNFISNETNIQTVEKTILNTNVD